jgi:4-amino-4-deoxy-L-arabinose transferase-like glycosyltransferase
VTLEEKLGDKLNISFFENWFEKPDLSRVAFLLLLSLLIKAVVFANVQVINPDGVRFINSAHELFQGNFQQAFGHEKMLFYSFTLGVFNFFIRDWFLAGLLLSICFLTLTLIPLYYLTRDMFGAKAAFWAGVAFSVIPSVNGLSAEVVKGGPFLFFMASALFLGIRAVERKQWAFFPLTFICAALASLYRFEGIIFIFGYVLFLAVLLVKKENRKACFKGLCGYLAIPFTGAVVFLVISLTGAFEALNISTVWNRFADHYFKMDILANYHLIYDFLKSAEKQFPHGQWGQDFFEIARHNLAWMYLLGLVNQFVKSLCSVFLIPLIWGFIAFDKRRPALLGLVWITFLFFAMNYLFILEKNFHSTRYLLVVILMLMPFIGFGMEHLFSWSGKLKFSRFMTISILVLMVLLPAFNSYKKSIEEKGEIRQAAEWLKDQGDILKGKILANEERVLLHAGLFRNEYDFFPADDLKSMERRALEKKCSMIVLRNRRKGALPGQVFKNYALIHEFPGPHGEVLIFSRQS